ncbi:hypothetical protein WMY93_010424 [Mugilogobius chulae]|uniref:Uncharacterized protein n=1 Tax=Mugilogobius chulae TaxID=88201 RepID=A0AAW0P7D9_9GOBI
MFSFLRSKKEKIDLESVEKLRQELAVYKHFTDKLLKESSRQYEQITALELEKFGLRKDVQCLQDQILTCRSEFTQVIQELQSQITILHMLYRPSHFTQGQTYEIPSENWQPHTSQPSAYNHQIWQRTPHNLTYNHQIWQPQTSQPFTSYADHRGCAFEIPLDTDEDLSFPSTSQSEYLAAPRPGLSKTPEKPVRKSKLKDKLSLKRQRKSRRVTLELSWTCLLGRQRSSLKWEVTD